MTSNAGISWEDRERSLTGVILAAWNLGAHHGRYVAAWMATEGISPQSALGNGLFNAAIKRAAAIADEEASQSSPS